jgi:hypothetical protein
MRKLTVISRAVEPRGPLSPTSSTLKSALRRCAQPILVIGRRTPWRYFQPDFRRGDVGSIEGAGSYLLGSKALTVGPNNLSTEVSGIIADGGSNGGTGGALIKVGTGTLTLTGLNTLQRGNELQRGHPCGEQRRQLGGRAAEL